MLKRLLKIISLSICLLLSTAVAPTLTFTNAEPFEKPEIYYTTVNGYFYYVGEHFDVSPDSFETWVRLPENSSGGTIFGTSTGYVRIFVDALGYFGLAWGDGSIKHTFGDAHKLNDGVWHHIALIRTSDTFTYYLDGEVGGVYEIATEALSNELNYNIGTAHSHGGGREPFEGYIRQMTVYHGAIGREQVQSDMQNNRITAADALSSDTKILGNWYLGEYWTERVVKNDVDGYADALLHTFDKYVGADYSFGDYDYTFVVFPDIQIMTNYNEIRLRRQVRWLALNKDTFNVKFAMFVGDLSDFGQREDLYERAADAMSQLDNVIPYTFVPGNHDYDNNANTRSQVYFNRYFPVSKHSLLPGFGGVMEEESMCNNYYTVNADGVDYLIISLEYDARLKTLRWAGRVIEEHPNHRVIIETHNLVQTNNTFAKNPDHFGYEASSPQKVFDELVAKYDNVFLAVSGHRIYDDILYRYDYGDNGNRILSMLVDGQGTKYNGENAQDMLLLVHVNEAKKTMNFVYYSPEKGKVWNIQNQFQLSFADPMNPTIGG